MEIKDLGFELTEEQEKSIEKLIQSKEDSLRTKYTQQIKDLEQYKPKEKTEQEIEFENAQNELKELKFKLAIKEKGIDENLSKFLKSDIDFDEFSNVFKGFAELKQDYIAKNHTANAGLTKEQFNKLGYEEKAKIYSENPTLYAELNNK